MRSFPHNRRRRQLSDGATGAASPVFGDGDVTIVPATVAEASLGTDGTHTASISGLAPLTATVTSAPVTSSSPPALSTASAAPENNAGTHLALSTGAIVGLVVGIFAVFALILVVVMTARHRRRLRTRSNSGSRRPARKSWTRIDEPAPLQMRATNIASIADGNTRGGDESFLSLKSTHDPLAQPPPPSQNPFLVQPPSQGSVQDFSQAPQLPPMVRNAEDANIPNPFSSPPTSPSHSLSLSHSHSHASTHSSAHALAPSALPSIQRAQIHSVAASSVSDYPYSLTDPDHDQEPSSRFSADPPPVASPARLVRKPSSKAQDAHARARELRAMQDLISALDRRGPPPSAFPPIDTAAASRLSRGEGLVTPGGHSVSSAKEEHGTADGYWTAGEERLPPASVFRSALNMGDRN